MQLPHSMVRSRTHKLEKSRQLRTAGSFILPVRNSDVLDQFATSIGTVAAKSGRTPNSCIA
jgi:hypothetical protein